MELRKGRPRPPCHLVAGAGTRLARNIHNAQPSVLIDDSAAVPNVEPELLVATWTPSGELTFCNAAWRSTLGSSETPWMRLPDADRRRATEAVLEAASGTLVTNFITQAHTQQRDEPLPILLNFVPVYLPGEGDTRRVQAVTTSGEVLAEPASWPANQTQRHRLEALGRMTMGIAHDFKNLLSGLVGHVELLRESPDEDASLNTALTAFERVASDGTALIEKLQQFIRQENEVHFEPVDLNALIEDCVALTQPYWYNEPRREGIEISVEQELDELPPIDGSPAELREVFVNLILNAVQAMPEGGTISIRTTPAPNDTVQIEVADTGTGMTAEVREQIFEPLFTTKGDRGTGMGLAVTYGIVQEHDGTIRVDSAPGTGTTFSIRLPQSSTSDVPKPRTTDDDAPVETEPVRVLVVDDEEMVRTVVRKLLGLKGHTIRLAASGPEALDAADAFAPDIVFTDFGMPDMNGLQLAAALRETHPSLPIVLLTGEARDTDDTLGVIDDVIDKPFKLHDLQHAIHTLTGPPDASAA